MIVLDIILTGQGVLMSLAGILMLVLGVILLLKNVLHQQPKQTSTSSSLENRKYAAVDAFRWSSTFLNLGLVLAVGATVLAFNWTTYEEEVVIPQGCSLFFDDDIAIIPRTNYPPPPPLPPPPASLIEPMVDEAIEEDPVFEDTSIESNEEVIAPPPSFKKKIPAPLPPPPPPSRKTIDLFKVVEEMPRFPGCEDETDRAARKRCAQRELLEYIYNNIKYPPIARETSIQGTVVVRFVVEADGSISNAEVVRDVGGQLGQEALRVVEKMGKEKVWIPGKQRGKKVRVQFNIPVKFRLE